MKIWVRLELEIQNNRAQSFKITITRGRLLGPIALSVSIALAVLGFKSVLLKSEVLEFNRQLRTKLNVIAV